MTQEPGTRDKLFADITGHCATPGCPMCHLMHDVMHSYMDSVMNEYILDIPARAEMREARGYCKRHAWYLPEGRGRVLGIAIIHDDILKNVLRAIDEPREPRRVRRRAQALLKRLRPSRECPACIYERKMDEVTTRALLKYLHDPEFARVLSASSGLCLRHFFNALEFVRDDATYDQLLAVQERTLSTLQMELAEFIRKSDYRFQHEGFGKEGDSWLRAIAVVSGEKGAR
ncbi:MAG: hypothetical protein GX620_12650 [Chloroflexi bacterium]|nr:hypothetical protein [Chloroflexota bacterium]